MLLFRNFPDIHQDSDFISFQIKSIGTIIWHLIDLKNNLAPDYSDLKQSPRKVPSAPRVENQSNQVLIKGAEVWGETIDQSGAK